MIYNKPRRTCDVDKHGLQIALRISPKPTRSSCQNTWRSVERGVREELLILTEPVAAINRYLQITCSRLKAILACNHRLVLLHLCVQGEGGGQILDLFEGGYGGGGGDWFHFAPPPQITEMSEIWKLEKI